MKIQNFSTTLAVDASPDDVFDAVNNVRGWWSEGIEGPTDQPGAEFRHRYQDAHRCTLKVTELVPGKKVAWHVVENYFSFVKESREWTGTDIVFEISQRKDGKTELRFTHVGLVPAYECYDACSNAWASLIQDNLRELITAGQGRPDPQGGAA